MILCRYIRRYCQFINNENYISLCNYNIIFYNIYNICQIQLCNNVKALFKNRIELWNK